MGALTGVLAVLIGCCVVAALYNIVRGEHIARALTPPEYPRSSLVEVEQERFPNTRWEHRTYYSPDSVATVLAYMEQHMPGFTRRSAQRYDNRRRDTGVTSQITGLVLRVVKIESGVPDVKVRLEEGDAAGTEITVIVSWPDP